MLPRFPHQLNSGIIIHDATQIIKQIHLASARVDCTQACPNWPFSLQGVGEQGCAGPPEAAGVQPWETRQFSGLLMSAVVSGKAPACE